MDKNSLNISKIESFLMSILENNVGDAVFVSTPTSTLSSTLTSFCIIDANDISDYDAYGSGSVLLYLYAKPFADGRKNSAKISAMSSKINEIIDNNTSEVYEITRRNTYSDYDNLRSWHYDVVELIIKIV